MCDEEQYIIFHLTFLKMLVRNQSLDGDYKKKVIVGGMQLQHEHNYNMKVVAIRRKPIRKQQLRRMKATNW